MHLALLTGLLSLVTRDGGPRRAARARGMAKRKRPDHGTMASCKAATDSVEPDPPATAFFRETTPAEAATLTDGVRLHSPHSDVIMPWVGYGTYRLGRELAEAATAEALGHGYRAIDTAFVYGGETTEAAVGRAIEGALRDGTVPSRAALFVTTKHWRAYHGYEPAWECLRLSLERLRLSHVDLWLMHWPGPAWTSMARRADAVAADPWCYAATPAADMARLRAETWRAMEDACRAGRARAIGVSNMTVRHLEALRRTATLWPPAVNQVELHPLHPQEALLAYCRREGIVVQAYSSLGGQDTGAAKWKELLGPPIVIGPVAAAKTQKAKRTDTTKMDLMHAEPVVQLARKVNATPAQVLLRWALEQGCPVIPKSSSLERMVENTGALNIRLSVDDVTSLQMQLMHKVKTSNPTANEDEIEILTRLAWRRDPLRYLNFD